MNLAQLKLAPKPCIFHDLRQGVGQPARTDIVHHSDRILLPEGNASVNDHLSTSLHLRIAALHTGKIELRSFLGGSTTRSSASAQTDEHGRAAQDNGMSPVVDVLWIFEGVLGPNVGNPACQPKMATFFGACSGVVLGKVTVKTPSAMDALISSGYRSSR